MISIVVSTRKKDETFKQMLLKTVGLKDVQILMYENNGEYSLPQIYNQGLTNSVFDVVVFLHDDIIMNTQSWGKKLLDNYKNNPEYGILGVAGSRELVDGRWWSNRSTTYGIVSHTDGKKTWKSEFSRSLQNNIQEVVVVDGVFFSIDKSKIKKHFNEEYKGFHFYDISFCLENYLKGTKIGVHTNILLTHKSVGATNLQWEENRIQLLNSHKDNLPVKIDLDVTFIEPRIILNQQPKLAIIIPTKNNVDDLLIPCVNSIVENTFYQSYTIYIADTGSDSVEKSKISDFLTEKNQNEDIVELIEYDYYNFAKINNDVVKNKIPSDTELILFCNNDIEMINDAISIMVETYLKNKKDCGTVGCRLHYEDGSIQHMGMVIQTNNENNIDITHKFLGWDYKNTITQTSVVHTHGNTAAFMLMNKSLFENIGGFNEEYVECFEDVELNLQCFLKGKRNLTNSNAVCYHYESQTRGKKIDQNDVNKILGLIKSEEKIMKTLYKQI